jgi:hypothetical protein
MLKKKISTNMFKRSYKTEPLYLLDLTYLVNLLQKGQILWMIKIKNRFAQHIMRQVANVWHAFRIYMAQLT